MSRTKLTRALAQTSTSKQIAGANIDSQLREVQGCLESIREHRRQGKLSSIQASNLVEQSKRLLIYSVQEAQLQLLEDRLVGEQ